MADYFEPLLPPGPTPSSPRTGSRRHRCLRQQQQTSYAELPFRPEQLAEMVTLISGGKIGGKIAKEILPSFGEGGSPAAIVDERGLGMISDPAAIKPLDIARCPSR